MPIEIYFMHRIRHYKNANEEWVWEKGIEVYDSDDVNNLEAAKGSFYAYMGAHAYGRNKSQEVDYVCCEVTDIGNNRIVWEKWNNLPKTEADNGVAEASEE